MLPDELYANALAHVVVEGNTTAPENDQHPPPVIVTYRLHGLNLGPFVGPGQDPTAGTVIDQEQLQELVEIIAPYTEWIRTYGTGLGLDHVSAMARGVALKVAVGAWISSDLEANEREIDAVIEVAKAGDADMIIVGAEVLLRRDVTPTTLIDYIERVKQQVPHLPVTTADAYGVLLSNPQVVAVCDTLCANFYPY